MLWEGGYPPYLKGSDIDLQWNLGIRDTHGTVKNCPEFWGGLISQVQFYVLIRPRDWSSYP